MDVTADVQCLSHRFLIAFGPPAQAERGPSPCWVLKQQWMVITASLYLISDSIPMMINFVPRN